MKSRTALCLLSAATALTVFAIEPSATLFENDSVRVIRAIEKAHVKGSFHEHKPNRVMVYFQPGDQRFEYQDGRPPAVFHWKPGQVVWSPAEGFHSPEVVSDEPFNIVEVEVKKPAVPGTAAKATAGARDALRADSKHFKLEFENDQVRVLRLTLPVHEATPMIESTHNMVAIYVTDQDAKVTDGAGKVSMLKHKAADASWEMPAVQKIENTGDKPLEMIVAELR